MTLAHLLATSSEARYQTLVTLTVGILAILAALGGLVWRVGVWIQRQAAATRANTAALMGSGGQAGLIETVADMRLAVDRLTAQLEVDERGRTRRRYRGRAGRDRTTR